MWRIDEAACNGAHTVSVAAVLDGAASWHVETGDCLATLRSLPEGCVQTCVTSPPYYGLRNYGVAGQIGLERTPDEYVARLVEVFREVRRTLRADGTLWLNLGDSYATGGGKVGDCPGGGAQGARWRGYRGSHTPENSGKHAGVAASMGPLIQPNRLPLPGLKPKDLIGSPWKLAFALRDDGWTLRADIVWSKSNPMPESVTDRPTKSHEYIFLFSKSRDYFYDAESVKQPVSGTAHSRGRGVHPKAVEPGLGIKSNRGFSAAVKELVATRNLRTVWTIAVHPVREAHFATFPPALVTPCILAGSSGAGACGRCGAPHVRLLGERQRVAGRTSGNVERKVARDGERARINTHLGSSIPWDPTATPTIGWRPTCRCEAPIVPCLVLDPFSGAGTTGLVARQLGRRFLGIELNPEYVAIAERRIAGAMPSEAATPS